MFFGLKIAAPWPQVWPEGRLIHEEYRHTTLAFLGSVSYPAIEQLLSFPHPSFLVGPSGHFNRSLLLPKKRPRVTAWEIEWYDDMLLAYQKSLKEWLSHNGFDTDKREWLSHVTLSRRPFDAQKWIKFFHPLPCFGMSIDLFESLGNSNYRTIRSLPLLTPFEEIDHMADLAFQVYGNNLKDLQRNAFTALAFKYPALLHFRQDNISLASLEDVVIILNEIISNADASIGCPFKAVSFHGELQPINKDLIKWEMIVDV